MYVRYSRCLANSSGKSSPETALTALVCSKHTAAIHNRDIIWPQVFKSQLQNSFEILSAIVCPTKASILAKLIESN